MGGFINEKILPKVMAFVNTKPVQALKDGMVLSMPMLIVGSAFLIFANLPIQAAADALAAAGITDILNQAYGATFSISAMIAVIGIAYNYAKQEKQEPLSGGILALCTFLLLQPASITSASGDVVGNIIDKTWAGGQGMIGAIIVGLVVGKVYSWFLKKDIRIKMPAGVPVGVANAFSALIPGAVVIAAATLIHGVFTLGFHQTAMEAIYTMIQTPLQGLTDSLGGVIIYAFLVSFLWFFGVHGSTICSGIMSGLFQANFLENQAILDKGLELTVANGGHIVTQQFIDQFITVTGSGVTIGIVIYMFTIAKSQQLKGLGRLEIGPALFNINEPILFGLPIVMNPLMAVPFIATPVVIGIVQYFALATGLCPLYKGIVVPWTTPPIISGFLVGDWRTALLQVVCMVISFFIYLPFVRKIDVMNVANEKAAAEAGDDDDEDW